MQPNEVFTPYSYPKHTYVQRGSEQLEQKVKQELNHSSRIVSLSGPSKSGKTVLVQRVVDDDRKLIEVSGSKIKELQDVGKSILDDLDIPSSVETRKMVGRKVSDSIKGSLSGIVGFLTGKVSGKTKQTKISEKSEIKSYDKDKVSQAIDELEDRDIVLFIDDFHYIDRRVQEKIAEVMKVAINEGLTVCTALVPHRGDDLQRANSDLQGRVWSLDVDYWSEEDLKRIANKGFKYLDTSLTDDIKEEFAKEAAGSPQLMQQMCLESCKVAGEKKSETIENHISDNKTQEKILKRVVNSTNHQSTIEILDTGPKTRGKERNTYEYEDGEGDVYRTILRAISRNRSLSIDYNTLKDLVEGECVNSSPTGSSITSSCEKMDERMKDEFPQERYLEWDSTKQVLYIPDPYLSFYLRWSDWEDKLEKQF